MFYAKLHLIEVFSKKIYAKIPTNTQSQKKYDLFKNISIVPFY